MYPAVAEEVQGRAVATDQVKHLVDGPRYRGNHSLEGTWNLWRVLQQAVVGQKLRGRARREAVAGIEHEILRRIGVTRQLLAFHP